MKNKQKTPTWETLFLRCLGAQSSIQVSWSMRSRSHRSLDLDLAAILTRRCGDPLGLGVTAFFPFRSPRPGSNGLTQTQLLMLPLGAMEPWAASASRPAREPWLGKGWVAQLRNVSLESRLPKSPAALVGPRVSQKLVNSIILVEEGSWVSRLPPCRYWDSNCRRLS